jgi:cystathionine beta-synthase
MQTDSFVNNSILETIGNTPMVELHRQDTGLCRLFVKLENQNPGGSIKEGRIYYNLKDFTRLNLVASGTLSRDG